MSWYVYVDGENHYMRSKEECEKVHGVGLDSIKPQTTVNRLYHRAACQFFWDSRYNDPVAQAAANRTVYVTSAVGNADEFHQHCLAMRNAGIEPVIIEELGQKKKQRQHQLEKDRAFDKAKGVDVYLATRMLEDAINKNYTHCHLFTSDADYLPVIEAVRRLGRVVHVYGYRDALGKNSKLEYVPDHFFNLCDMMKHQYRKS